MSELSHIDDEGEARMVDVSAKPEQEREAVARGEIRLANHEHGGLLVEVRFPVTGKFVQPESLSAGVR